MLGFNKNSKMNKIIYQFAKSTCNNPNPSSSIVPVLDICNLVFDISDCDLSHLGNLGFGKNFLSKVTTPVGAEKYSY